MLFSIMWVVKVLSFLKWFFSTSGIQYTTAKPLQAVLFGKCLGYFNTLLGVQYRPKGPTVVDTSEWLKWGKFFMEYKCKFCGVKVWSYKKVEVCGCLSCFRKNGSKWG